MQDTTLFELPVPATEYWANERCSVCGRGFSAKSWDEHHTGSSDRLSVCHAQCCKAPDCRAARKARKEN